MFNLTFVNIIQTSLRRKRGKKLLNLIAEYDYACFRCPIQREHKNSLRIGISPDATLAYIDILFNEEEYSPAMKPINPVGQPKLPAAFKLAGLGTYWSPFYVDTNDMILQAVPQTDVASVFIDEEWISFIVELNTVLRTVHIGEIHYGLLRLIRFLQTTKKEARLGGLVVEFCSFANTFVPEVSQPEEKKPAESAAEAPAAAKAEVSEGKVDSDEERESIASRETFSAMNQSHRHSFDDQRGGNWFLNHIGEAFAYGNRNSRAFDPKDLEASPQKESDIEMRKSDDQKNFIDQNYFIAQFKTTLRHLYKNLRRFYRRYSLKWNPFTVLGFSTQRPKGIFPDGLQLNFSSMCFGIERGVLKMGIFVTHEKVALNRYIVGDGDYCSADDAESFSVNMWRYSDISDTERKENFGLYINSAGTSEPVDEQPTEVKLKKVFGKKAAEMAKFHRILMAAEENMSSLAEPSLSAPPAKEEPTDSVNNVADRKDPNSGSVSPTEDKGKRLPSRRRKSSVTAERAREKSANALPSSLSPPGITPSSTVMRPSLKGGSVAENNSSDKEYFEFIPTRRVSLAAADTFERESIFLDDDDDVDEERGRFSQSKSKQLAPSPSRIKASTSVKGSKSSDKKKSSLVSKFFSGSSASQEEGKAPVAVKRRSSNRTSEGGYRSSTAERRSSGITAEQLTERKSSLKPASIRQSLSLRKSEVAPPRLSIIRRRRRSTNVTRKTKISLADKNLAPSALQQVVNIWRLTKDEFEPISDSLAALIEAPEDEGEKLDSLERQSEDPSLLERSRRHLSVGSNASSTSLSNDDYSTRWRRGMTMTTNPSFRPTSGTQVALGAQSTQPSHSAPAGSHHKSMVDESTVVSSRAEKSLSTRKKRKFLAVDLPFIYLVEFFLSHINWLAFGSNIYPFGPHYTWKILAMILIVLCFADLVTMTMSLITVTCLSPNATACNNHDQLLIIILVWPLAIMWAPLSGLIAIMLGPSASLARQYCMFSHLAGINNTILFITFVNNLPFFSAQVFGIYPVIFLSGSRLFQCMFIDLYISHIERLRYTRGWDGLNTSLFKTVDHKQEIIVISRNLKKEGEK